MTAGKCRACDSIKTVHNGSVKGKSKIKCKDCRFQSVLGEDEERVYAQFKPCPTWKRPAAVLLYACGVNITITSKILKVGTTTVQRWIKKFTKDFLVSPIPEDATVVEDNEMWHYLKKCQTSAEPGKPIVEITNSSLTGNLALVITIPLEGQRNNLISRKVG